MEGNYVIVRRTRNQVEWVDDLHNTTEERVQEHLVEFYIHDDEEGVEYYCIPEHILNQYKYRVEVQKRLRKER